MYDILRILPKNHLSALMGALVHLRLPVLSPWSVSWFVKRFGIDLSEARQNLAEFRCIGDVFVRELREDARPIAQEPVSPVDGTLRGHAAVQSGFLEQIKGKTYPVEKLIGDPAFAPRYQHGYSFNFYLSPPDYHHIHSPLSGTIIRTVHTPGKLWPVNDWSLSHVEDLFVVNERVTTFIDSAFGIVALVMIGATNVGKISLSYDNLNTNRVGWLPALRPRTSTVRTYPAGRAISVGAKLGTFHMGSSVLVLFEESARKKIEGRVRSDLHQQKMRCGETLLI